MGSMIDDEYTSKFLKFLRYAPYLKDGKQNIQSFINGFLVAFKGHIDFDEPHSLEEPIRKLKHCYGQSKHKPELKCDWKGNEKTKGKWPQKKGRYQDVGEKENLVPCKKFTVEKGHGS